MVSKFIDGAVTCTLDPWNHVTCTPTKPGTECDRDNEIRLFDLILGTKRLMK